MRRFASHQIVGALALILALGGCGKGSDEGNAALASLDTRLTGIGDEGNIAAAPTKRDAATLGSLAEAQRVGTDKPVTGGAVQRIASAAGRPVGGCAGRGLRYGDEWAEAMPEGLGLYPGARLVEAAGTDTGRCALRVMSFTTDASPDAVTDYYAKQVRQAGFDAERQPCRTEIRLGGTRSRDDAAYLLFVRRGANGLTEVDVIASAGPTV